jgi:hypothetical protein
MFLSLGMVYSPGALIPHVQTVGIYVTCKTFIEGNGRRGTYSRVSDPSWCPISAEYSPESY